MDQIKIFPAIPELEFLLTNPQVCTEKQIAEGSNYLNGYGNCRKCNGTRGNARVLDCERYKTAGNGERK